MHPALQRVGPLDTPTPQSAATSTINARAPGSIRARDVIRSPLPRRSGSPGGLTIQPAGSEKARRDREARLSRQVSSRTQREGASSSADEDEPIHGFVEPSPRHGDIENRRSRAGATLDEDATSSHSQQMHYDHLPRRPTITVDSEDDAGASDDGGPRFDESYKSNFSANANGLRRAFEEVNLQAGSPVKGQRNMGSVDDYPTRGREVFGSLATAQQDSPTRSSKHATETHGFSVQDKTWPAPQVPQNSHMDPTPRRVVVGSNMSDRRTRASPRAPPPPSTVRSQRQMPGPRVPSSIPPRQVAQPHSHRPAPEPSEPSDLGDDESLMSSPPQAFARRAQHTSEPLRTAQHPVADLTGITDGIASPEKVRRALASARIMPKETEDSHLDHALQRVHDDLETARGHYETVHERFERDSGIGDSPDIEDDEPVFPDPLASKPTLVSRRELSQYHRRCLESLDRVSSGYQRSVGELRTLHTQHRQIDMLTQTELLKTLEHLGEELGIVKKILRALVDMFAKGDSESRHLPARASLLKRRSDPGLRHASPPPRERSPTPDVLELADKLGNRCRHTCDECRAHVAREVPRARAQAESKPFETSPDDHPHPSATLLRKIAELEVNLDWQKGMYHDLWSAYKQRDPSTQRASRKALAEHMQHVFKTIEETADRISGLYGELHDVYGHADVKVTERPQQPRRATLFH